MKSVKNVQALRRRVPMDSIGLRKKVALGNDQFGHVSLNLLCFSRTLRGRQVVNMGVWQGKAKCRKGKSHKEKRESLKVKALPFFSFDYSPYFPKTILPPTMVV